MLSLTDSDLEIQYEPAGLTFVTNRIGCPKAAQEDLGFEWRIDLRDGMQRLIDWRNSDRAAVEARRLNVKGLSFMSETKTGVLSHPENSYCLALQPVKMNGWPPRNALKPAWLTQAPKSCGI